MCLCNEIAKVGRDMGCRIIWLGDSVLTRRLRIQGHMIYAFEGVKWKCKTVSDVGGNTDVCTHWLADEECLYLPSWPAWRLPSLIARHRRRRKQLHEVLWAGQGCHPLGRIASPRGRYLLVKCSMARHSAYDVWSAVHGV